MSEWTYKTAADLSTALDARRVSAVRWGIAGNIVVAWIVTLPATAAIAAATYWLTSLAR